MAAAARRRAVTASSSSSSSSAAAAAAAAAPRLGDLHFLNKGNDSSLVLLFVRTSRGGNNRGARRRRLRSLLPNRAGHEAGEEDA